ncbi:hypothetical protein V8D89_002109, partial [Ganoderma adspersum]
RRPARARSIMSLARCASCWSCDWLVTGTYFEVPRRRAKNFCARGYLLIGRATGCFSDSGLLGGSGLSGQRRGAEDSRKRFYLLTYWIDNRPWATDADILYA